MRLFLSDLHLENPDSSVFRTFAAIMARESARCRDIYILGDLTEVWVGDDDDGPLAESLRQVLRTATGHTRVHLLRGNRDFLFGQTFADDTGVVLIEDPLLLDDGTLLAHGDAFCIDDEPYQRLRAMLRSEAWQQEVLGQSLEARRALAAGLRAESRASSANKAANIMDVAEREVARVMSGSGAVRLIHGHTHRPGEHAAAWGRRYVLGAWERCAWLGRQHGPGQAPTLECLPLVSPSQTSGPL